MPTINREARINEGLKHLGEEFHAGMVPPEEYRQRRRLLLESWAEADVTTSPRVITRVNRPPGEDVAPTRINRAAEPPPPPKKSRVPSLAVGIALAAAAGVLIYMYAGGRPVAGPAASAPTGNAPTAASPGPAASAAVASVHGAADEFLNQNHWEPADIDGFLQRWRALSPGDRRLAVQDSSVRALRGELERNIQSAQQLDTPDAGAQQHERLNRLQEFAQALDGEGT